MNKGLLLFDVDFNETSGLNRRHRPIPELDLNDKDLLSDSENEEVSHWRRGEPDRQEIQMSVVYHNSKIACCYYDAERKCLFYLKDIQETERFELVGLLIQDVNPNVLITSEKSDPRFLNFLRIRLEHGCLDYSSQMSHNPETFKTLKILPAIDFDYELAKQCIFTLDTLNEMPSNMSESEKIIYFSALFDLECRLGVSCVGGLLKFLRKTATSELVDFNSSRLVLAEIFSVQPLKLDKLLLLDANAFQSLQIFSEVDYACAYKQTHAASAANFRTCLNDNNTQTLYALYLSKIRTRMGIGKLRSYMLKPTRDRRVLATRHRFIEFFIDNQNKTLVRFLQQSLKSCKSIGTIMKRMKTSKCSLADWKRMLATTQAFQKVIYAGRVINERLQLNPRSEMYASSAEYFECVPESSVGEKEETIEENMFTRVIDRDYSTRFDNLLSVLTQTINFKKSIESKTVVVDSSVSECLNEKRAFFNSLPELLTNVAREEIHKYNLIKCTMAYMPMLGFLIKIKNDAIQEYVEINNCLDETTSSQGASSTVSASTMNRSSCALPATAPAAVNSNTIEQARDKFERRNPTFKRIYAIEDETCYKNARCREMDAEIGDISMEINDIVFSIVDSLQSTFIRYSHVYADMSDVCAELDCLLAFAQVAAEQNYVRPELALGELELAPSFLSAENVRHPMVELNLDTGFTFVPNSVESGSLVTNLNDNKIKIITGPNASGKTIYIKQTGLLVYMSMIGSYVAASRATVGDFDRIYTRLSTNECISLQMSSYSIDLKQLTDALNGATHRSLVLIDEFGRGTELTDGEALVAATVRYLISNKFPMAFQSPHVLLVTHFYEIFHSAHALFDDRINRLKFLSTENFVEGTNSTKEFLYKVKEGITASSYATDIARRVGLPETVVKKAEEIFKAIRVAIVKDLEKECENSSSSSSAAAASPTREVLSSSNNTAARETSASDAVTSSAPDVATTSSMTPSRVSSNSSSTLIPIHEDYARQKGIVKEALQLNLRLQANKDCTIEDKQMAWTEFFLKHFS